MTVLAALAAVALAVPAFLGPGLVSPPLPGSPAEPPADDGPTVDLTADVWGSPASLQDDAHPVYAHLAARSTLTTVTATIHFSAPRPAGFTATLADANAAAGQQPASCASPSAPVTSVCRFGIAVSGGLNALTLTLTQPGTAPITVPGRIFGGSLAFSGGLEAVDAVGLWQRIPDAASLQLPATGLTSLRYVLRNVGGMPFRASGACSGRVVDPGRSLACPISGPRPAGSFTAGYHRVVAVTDPLGSVGSIVLAGSIDPAPVSFRLTRGSYVVGQPAEIAAQGFGDADLGYLVVRVGSRSVRLSNESTATRILFSIPFVEPGTTTLDVLDHGVAVARLPLVITASPQPDPHAAPPVASIVTAAAGGLVALLLLVRAGFGIRRRARYSAPGATSRTA